MSFFLSFLFLGLRVKLRHPSLAAPIPRGWDPLASPDPLPCCFEWRAGRGEPDFRVLRVAGAPPPPPILRPLVPLPRAGALDPQNVWRWLVLRDSPVPPALISNASLTSSTNTFRLKMLSSSAFFWGSLIILSR